MMEQRVIGRGATVQSSKGRSRVVIMGEVTLDSTKTLEALKMVLGTYAAELVEDSPMTVVLIGNFVQRNYGWWWQRRQHRIQRVL
jgi:DNA polymerase epsilon subunit 2